MHLERRYENQRSTVLSAGISACRCQFCEATGREQATGTNLARPEPEFFVNNSPPSLWWRPLSRGPVQAHPDSLQQWQLSVCDFAQGLRLRARTELRLRSSPGKVIAGHRISRISKEILARLPLDLPLFLRIDEQLAGSTSLSLPIWATSICL